jgi:hypothetical protein
MVKFGSAKQRFLGTLAICFSLSLMPAALGARKSSPAKWLTYKGAHFEVKYPATFKARPSLKSISFDGQYDSAVFTAPDGSAEFYVFAPMWNGKPTDIEIDPAREEVLSQHTETKGTVNVRRVTITAKDKSYIRSFEDSENTDLNIRRVFGFKYRDQNAYHRYKQHYLTFKRSLQQFSD